MNVAQMTAIAQPCLLATETLNPDFARRIGLGMIRILSINAGYE